MFLDMETTATHEIPVAGSPRRKIHFIAGIISFLFLIISYAPGGSLPWLIIELGFMGSSGTAPFGYYGEVLGMKITGSYPLFSTGISTLDAMAALLIISTVLLAISLILEFQNAVLKKPISYVLFMIISWLVVIAMVVAFVVWLVDVHLVDTDLADFADPSMLITKKTGAGFILFTISVVLELVRTFSICCVWSKGS